MKRREWVYIMPPSAYEVSCDLCGGEVEWSEYERMVWCWRCLKDTPGNQGVFGGPIPIEASQLLGICFDKIDLKTGKRLYMKVPDGKRRWAFKENDIVWEVKG